MTTDGPEVPTDRRAMLAAKGRRLYGKYCGTGGRGICSESFAVYHLGRGESFVAADLLAYLEVRAAEFAESDPEGRLAMTAGLIARVRAHLAASDGLSSARYRAKTVVLCDTAPPDANP